MEPMQARLHDFVSQSMPERDRMLVRADNEDSFRGPVTELDLAPAATPAPTHDDFPLPD